jgi:ornithine cyclodeaminase/alanine dehydrogenase-like protein (mu-crystallin family)
LTTCRGRSVTRASVSNAMAALEIRYLNGADIAALALSDDEILDSIRAVLAAQGRRETVIEPRTHLFPRGARGHFNVLRGATPEHAGVKVVGDYVDNHLRGLPSELALLLLMDPQTGAPVAILDATAITEIRTGAVTAIGAEHLARADARSLGHIGARGTAYWNVRLLCRVRPGLEEIRVRSLRRESREAFARRLRADLLRDVRGVDNWEECVRGADVVVEVRGTPDHRYRARRGDPREGASTRSGNASALHELASSARQRQRRALPARLGLTAPAYPTPAQGQTRA